MKRTALAITFVTLALLATSCSEAAPKGTDAKSPGTTIPSTSCEGPKLLACARASMLGNLVPAKATKATGTPITLGMINQENTPAGSFPELSQAVQAAVTFVNDELGGVDGHPIKVEVCNTKFSTEGSTACGQKFVDENVPAVLGGIDVFGNANDVLDQNDIPFIGGIPVSTQSVTSPNSFQWSGGTWGATVAFADYAIHTLKAKNVAIVYSEFGSITDSARYGERVLKDSGIQVELVPFPIMSPDISTPLQAAAANKPDAIMVLAADTSCKAAFDALDAQQITATPFFTGACAPPTIIDPLPEAKTNGTIFNVEGPIARDNPGPDPTLYNAVINQYGKGLNPVGAGTVSFRSFMNLYAVMRHIGADKLSPANLIKALRATVDEPSFMGHPYTCDGKQFKGLPGICSPQQVLARMEHKQLSQVGGWIDVGAIYAATF